jgi:hypothetical protein
VDSDQIHQLLKILERLDFDLIDPTRDLFDRPSGGRNRQDSEYQLVKLLVAELLRHDAFPGGFRVAPSNL